MKKLFQNIYNILPFKQAVFTFLKLFWTPSESTYRHLHFKGILKVKIDETRSFKIKHYGFQLENEIFWASLTAGWEKESVKLWLKLSENAEVVFDVGANTGVYSLMAKAISPKARVYAIEPVSRVIERLKENNTLNDFDIIPVQKAFSNFDGKAIIYDTNADHIYSVTVNKNLNDWARPVSEIEIETMKLNTYIKQNNITKIDLMKLDVETHEPEVLEGFSDYFSKFRPTLLIEILNNEVGEKVQKLVEGLDYLYFNIDEKGGIRQVEKIVKSDYFNYLFCTKEVANKLGLFVSKK
jgi:FkbM family methyltransferase